MCRVIVVTSGKGGVGKTTVTANLRLHLAKKNLRVCLVDMDIGLNNLDVVMGMESRVIYNMLDVIEGRCRINQALVQDEEFPLLFLLATGNVAQNRVITFGAIERVMNSLKERFDYILIDCPPSLELLTVNAMAAADSVLVPVQCEYYALEGIADLTTTIKMINSRINPKLEIQGIVLTMYDGRTNVSEQVAGEIRRYFGDKVYRTVIPRNVRIAEAPSHGKPVIAYDRISRGSSAYLKLGAELVKQIEGK